MTVSELYKKLGAMKGVGQLQVVIVPREGPQRLSRVIEVDFISERNVVAIFEGHKND